jgi:hypothetical protein
MSSTRKEIAAAQAEYERAIDAARLRYNTATHEAEVKYDSELAAAWDERHNKVHNHHAKTP